MPHFQIVERMRWGQASTVPSRDGTWSPGAEAVGPSEERHLNASPTT